MNKYFKYLLFFLLFFILIDKIGGGILLSGIEKFYGLKQHSKILLIGHSHLMLSVDKNSLERQTGLSVSKYTREGVNVYDRYYMVKQYLDSPFCDSLKVVFYGVDQFSFVEDGLSQNSYKLFYPFMDEPVMDEYIKDNAADKRDYYTHKLFKLTRYSDALINASIRGWRNDFSNYKIGNIDIEAYKKNIQNNAAASNRKIEMEQNLVSVFDSTMKMITDKKIHVVLINTPVVDVLSNVDKEKYDQVIHFFKEYASNHLLVDYWDFNPDYSSNYSIFYDPIHLNPKGQNLITNEIVKKYNELDLQ